MSQNTTMAELSKATWQCCKCQDAWGLVFYLPKMLTTVLILKSPRMGAEEPKFGLMPTATESGSGVLTKCVGVLSLLLMSGGWSAIIRDVGIVVISSTTELFRRQLIHRSGPNPGHSKILFRNTSITTHGELPVRVANDSWLLSLSHTGIEKKYAPWNVRSLC